MQIRIAHRLKTDDTTEPTIATLDTEDYDAGLAELKAALPEAHVLLWINVDR
ncbi:hypothetical protein GUY44_07245 [Pimelobacter simplex]|uniref:Uncharacterized protein n=1 Tax=Nocardioides simplex TaxID=2045 RepID=A0A0C5WYT6_NOCSI|nr:hypothetical protein [Pimelobacter simplex]AJR18473.1 hypothetical protein KR76_00104 [Pimelobacter simplex]MCG8150268.1 hypothetical protein [Pimelobacter simplex]GEB13522.1 hypothetical protein NSI01_18370 [Pimelobacter simplex]SFM72318.1 hypothetical protein SAMN05421671_3149 [Pimelobacter simplex]